jgi:hypothetical protein
MFEDTELTILCEGDLTFRAADIDKFLAYIPHADVVNGSRIVEQLQERGTQLSLYMHYGNLFAGKVLELKHLGMVSLTDVGTTYKLCRNPALRRLLPQLDPRINLEFNAYFLDMALKAGLRILECPVCFFPARGREQGRQCEQPHRHAAGLADAAGASSPTGKDWHPWPMTFIINTRFHAGPAPPCALANAGDLRLSKSRFRRKAWCWNWEPDTAISSMRSRPGAGWRWIVWPGMVAYLDAGRGRFGHPHHPARRRGQTAWWTMYFSSNCFEHVSAIGPGGVSCPAPAKDEAGGDAQHRAAKFQILRPPSILTTTPMSPFTPPKGLGDLLEPPTVFKVVRCVPRFMPLTIESSRVPVHGRG